MTEEDKFQRTKRITTERIMKALGRYVELTGSPLIERPPITLSLKEPMKGFPLLPDPVILSEEELAGLLDSIPEEPPNE